jgi:hypothetical protein
MAKTTEEERRQLKERGLYASEKCDNCGKPLMEPCSYAGRGASKKEVWCSKCATGASLAHVLGSDGKVTKTEESDMAEKKEKKVVEKKEKKEKVLGAFREGTPMGDLATALADEKPHKLESILPAIRKTYKLAEGWRGIGPLKTVGEKKGLYGVIFDKEKGTIQIKLGKPAKKAEKKEEPEEKAPKEKASAKKEAKPTSKANGKEVVEEAPVTSKQQEAVQRLVRGTLKSGKDWTRNKLIEHLKDQHEIEPKRAQQAIADEIQKGGIEEDGGLLSLV